MGESRELKEWVERGLKIWEKVEGGESGVLELQCRPRGDEVEMMGSAEAAAHYFFCEVSISVRVVAGLGANV